jgi:hypothetical protein
LRVRGKTNRTPSPPFIRWRLGRLGQPGHDGPLTGRPAVTLAFLAPNKSPITRVFKIVQLS